MGDSLIAFLKVLPRAIELMVRIGKWMEANNVEEWMSELERSIDSLERAKSRDEKLDAARSLVRAMRGLI
jgi:uncharacterized protein YjcR